MEFRVGAKSDTGRKRTKNQDSFQALPELGFFMVADGMGGHRGGETASLLAVETVSESIKNSLQEKTPRAPETLLPLAVHSANQVIYQRSANEPNLKGMGTTATILLFCDKSLHIAQVGDSRCYLLRSHGFWQITRDHSMVEEKVRMGLITRAKAKTDEMKNVITRSVGFESTVDADLYHVEIQSGDLFMICSDGLSGLVDDLVLFQMIEDATARGESPQIIAEALIEEANSKGGDDNITSVVVQVK